MKNKAKIWCPECNKFEAHTITINKRKRVHCKACLYTCFYTHYKTIEVNFANH